MGQMNKNKTCQINAQALIAAVILMLFPFLSFGAVDVNVYDPTVYLYLDKLCAAGLLRTYMPGQRPLSRSVVAKLVREAREGISEGEPLAQLVAELETEFTDARSEQKTSLVLLDSFSLFYTATKQKESAVPFNGLGLTSGRVQPLLSYSNGDHYDRYGNIYSSSTHRARLGGNFAVYMQPRYFVKSGNDPTGGIGLYRGYIKAGAGNFEFQAGRDDIQWGPGENELLFSGNARALDMVKVSTPSPFRFPGFMKRLGQFRTTAFFSFLGNDYKPANATLSGYRVDYNPLRWWNLGFDHAVFLWGNGAQKPDFGTAVRSFIGLLSSSTGDRASSNHLMGIDTSFRIQRAMGMEFYVKLLLEDTQAETAYMLKNEASWLGGMYFPRIPGMEKLSLRGEYIYTGQIAYTHGFYADGFTIDNKFIGYDAGPDTSSAFISARYQFNFDEFLKADFRFLRRSADHYQFIYSTAGANIGDNIGIFRDADRPEESNYILKLCGQKRISKSANLYVEAGYDRKGNSDFAAGQSANDLSIRLGIIIHKF